VDLNYKTKLIFPVLLHQFDVNGFSEIKDELIDYAYDLKEKDPEGNLLSNRGGWQSKDFSIQNEDDVLQNFLTNCLAEFPSIKKSVKFFVSAWININPPDAFNMKHVHPTCDLSGVLWIKAPKDCGNIVFSAPNSFAISREIDSYNEDYKKDTCYYHSYHCYPTEGRMIVFPSHLEHYVDFNKSDEDRISVSFNIRLSDAN
jgi:uncharacterized protein (TIGR02466 family)